MLGFVNLFLAGSVMDYMDWFANQKCVYWPPESTESASADAYDDYGKPKVSLQPVEIDCRWSDKVEKFINAAGDDVMSNAIVLVTQDIEVGGILMLGEITDIVDEQVIKNNPNTWEIRRFDKTPDIDATEVLGKVFL